MTLNWIEGLDKSVLCVNQLANVIDAVYIYRLPKQSVSHDKVALRADTEFDRHSRAAVGGTGGGDRLGRT